MFKLRFLMIYVQKQAMLLMACFCVFTLGGQNKGTYQVRNTKEILMIGWGLERTQIDEVKVFVGRHPKKNQSPVAGTIALRLDTLFFFPYFPLNYQLIYTVKRNDLVLFHFDIPYPKHIPSPTIESVYPTHYQLPENLLKIYIHFSQAMREGNAYKAVKVFNQHGIEVKDPFVQLHPELWDQERKRLTLWLDPGKIKRGLNPNLSEGSPLKAGNEYTISILRYWKSALGIPLEKGLKKKIKVISADRKKPHLDQIQIIRPNARSIKPLIVDFQEPMDHALLLHTILVGKEGGGQVKGTIEVNESQTRWSLFPSVPWLPGDYKLIIDGKLEDLAGNNFYRLFDVDLQAPKEEMDQEVLTRYFKIE